MIVIRGEKDKKKIVGDTEQQALIKAGKDDSEGGEKALSTFRISNIAAGKWHNLKLCFNGSVITGFVDGNQVVKATDLLYETGMAGLLALGEKKTLSIPYFDNLLINKPDGALPFPTVLSKKIKPIYKAARK